jgi:hypothetical protein
MKTHERAFLEGYRAWRAAIAVSDNPYRADKGCAEAWEKGWKSGEMTLEGWREFGRDREEARSWLDDSKIRFERYIPYHINRKLLDTHKLEPYTAGEAEPVNTSAMSLMDILKRIADNNFQTDLDDALKRRADSIFQTDLDDLESFGYGVHIGEQYYSFSDPQVEGTSILTMILDTARKAGGLQQALHCDWYYYEDDASLHDPDECHRFFLCRGDRIIDPSRSIDCNPLSPSLVDNILLSESDRDEWSRIRDLYLNELEDRTALAHICYEKWQQETAPGRIWAMKARIEQERIERRGRYLTAETLPLLLGEIRSLRKTQGFIGWLLLAVIGLLVYIAVFGLR